MSKVFKIADIRKLEKQVALGEISYSRMVEIMNEMIDNKQTISNCDCFIGFLSSEEVRISNLKEKVDDIVNIQPIFKKYRLLNGEPQTAKQIIDGRKGYLQRFLFCPYCGKKIDWKNILINI